MGVYIKQNIAIKISQNGQNEPDCLDDMDDWAAVPVSGLLASHEQRARIDFSLPEGYGDGDSGPDPGVYFVIR